MAKSGMTVRQIKEHLKNMSEQEKLNYLDRIFDRTKGFTIGFTEKSRDNLYAVIDQVYEKTGRYDKLYRALAVVKEGQADYAASAEHYGQLGNHRKAAELYAKAGHLDLAIHQYTQYANQLEGDHKTIAAKNIRARIEALKRGRVHNDRGLGKIIASIFALGSVATGFLLLSRGITGNAVGWLNTGTTGIEGVLFLILGIALEYIAVRK